MAIIKEWKLYRKLIPGAGGAREYVWVDPGGIIRFNRVIAPVGFHVTCRSRVGQPAYGRLPGFNLVRPKARYTHEQIQEWLSQGIVI